MLKKILKKILPSAFLDWYHLSVSSIANKFYGRPSHWMVVIGVTGTNGKSTTVELISQMLRMSGAKVGHLATTTIRIGVEEWLNDTKMTMLGRFAMQKYLKRMQKAGCQYAVVEVTSQGLEQHRAHGIEFDIGILTNLTPEHIEAHGSFENYAKAKEKLFLKLENRPTKRINGEFFPTISIINIDSQEFVRYMRYDATKKFGYSTKIQKSNTNYSLVEAKNIISSTNGMSFEIRSQNFQTSLLGEFNVSNILAVVCVGLSLGYSLRDLSEWVLQLKPTPGRLEWIETNRPFKVLVDQAPEPESIKKLFDTVKQIHRGRIIHVFGSAGGGRDKARRPVLGQLSINNADISVITNEDPYDEDPLVIINQIKTGAVNSGGVENKDLFIVPDRRQAIERAFKMANNNDLVMITGKGCEQAIVSKNGKKIPWDDRKVAKELLEIQRKV